MKKLLISTGIVGTLLLAGCEEGTIVYEEKERPKSEVEEIIADQLEVENPLMDLDVDIYQESDE